MLVFYRPFTDPYFNIAAEEYFVKNVSEDICMVWISEPSVVIGKHQNAYGEINYPFLRDKQIPVIRRISGGGAVYHDLGNVNFSFIRRIKTKLPVDFSQFTQVITGFISGHGITVTSNKRNSLFTGNKKFSGHAEHIFHDKVLHHGTLLYNTDLETLRKCLIPAKKIETKALASERSPVANLAPLLPEHVDIHSFVNQFISWLMEFYPGSQSYILSTNDIEAINRLADTKYRTWEWNFAYSPVYSFTAEIPAGKAKLILKVKVENGIITHAETPGPDNSPAWQQLLTGLKGIAHHEEAIGVFFDKNSELLEPLGLNSVTFIRSFFM